MQAGDVMTLGAATVRANASVADAARLMLEHHISGLPVVDEDERLVGMVTERDLLRRAEIGTDSRRPRWLEVLLGAEELAQEYVRTHSRRIADVMTTEAVSVSSDTPLSEVVRLMERKGFKRLPVVRDGRVIGIVSRANLLRALAKRIDEVPSAAGADLQVRHRILEELDARGWMPSGGIDVAVHGGVVELHGVVGDEQVRRAICIAVENTPGVTQVDDRMRTVKPVPGWV